MSTRSSNAARPAPGGLVDIVSGSFGAGHDAAASAIAHRLHARGFQHPHLGRRRPDAGSPRPGRRARATSGRSSRRRRRGAGCCTPSSATSASPSASAAPCTRPRAACSRSRPTARTPSSRRTPSPARRSATCGSRTAARRRSTTYLTDMSVHRLWVHPACRPSTWPSTTSRRARRWRSGARSATGGRCPPSRTAFGRVGATTRDARRRHGAPSALPRDERLALVTGGSCGIGRLFESAPGHRGHGGGDAGRAVRHQRPAPRPGARAARHGRARLGRGHARAGVDAVDVVVQNAGGITSLETAAAGVPCSRTAASPATARPTPRRWRPRGSRHGSGIPDDLGVALLRALQATPMGCSVRRRRPARRRGHAVPDPGAHRMTSVPVAARALAVGGGVTAALQLLPALTRSPRCAGARPCRGWPGRRNAGTSH